MSFFEELKRRNVIRVGVAYVVAAWLLAQVVQLAAESFGAPDWVMKMVIILLIIGLLPTLFFSWAFELTPDGLRRETQVQPDQLLTQHTARKLDYMTMALLIGAIGFMVLDRFVLEPRAPALVPEAPRAAEDSQAARPAAEEIEANSIAVLPFVNMSNDPEQEYFSDGISEELLNLLARVDGVTVASRTSSFAYKGQTTAIPEIARDLKVANVLEGSVRKSGDQIRITAQLIDTRNDRHLWSDAFDRELTDIFAIQDEIANAIVNALRTELGLEQVAKDFTVTATTDNLDAYEIYLKARGLMLARVELAESVRLFEQAVSLDPQFAAAWAGLGAAAWIAPSWNVKTDRDYVALSRGATEKALELDENQSMAWAVLSRLRSYDDTGPDYETTLNYLDRALQIDPKNTTAWLWRGIAWSELGLHERALEDLEQCLALDPAYQNCRNHLAMQNIMLDRHERVRELSIQLLRAGFEGAMSAHIPYLVRRGELLGAAMLVFSLSRHPDFPGEEWLEALQHPEQVHSPAIAKAERWFRTDDSARIPIKLDLMLAFGAYDNIDTSERHNWNRIWQDGFPRFHESGQFKRLANELNLPVYWRKHGFPTQCRPLGDEDFECD